MKQISSLHLAARACHAEIQGAPTVQGHPSVDIEIGDENISIRSLH